MNHSLINASGHTHAKIAVLAIAVSFVFIAAVSGFGGKAETSAHAYGPVVKASTLTTVAGSGHSQVR